MSEENAVTAENIADSMTAGDNEYDESLDGWLSLSAEGNVVHIKYEPARETSYGSTADKENAALFEAHVFAAEPATPVADGPVSLPADDARELLYLGVGDGFDGLTVVSVTQTGSSRWRSTNRMVIRNLRGEHFAAYFQQGLTEQQETQPWDGQETAMFHPVVARTKVVRTVEWVKPAAPAEGSGEKAEG